MIGDAASPLSSPSALGGTSVGLHVYVADVDASLARAADAGATVTRPAEDMFYGDRMGMLEDPYGHIWVLLSHQEDLTTTEIEERGRAALA